ncbi:MAG: hypothetical protein CMI03_12940 [Oceanospirillaceae bacterium]|nr:hypothetical protein [Oceanospirillaceae bacterium]
MIFLVRRAWTILTGSKLNSRRLARRVKGMDAWNHLGERTATGKSHGRVASKNRENEDDAPESEKLGGALPAWGRSDAR